MAVWNETPEGQAVLAAFQQLQYAYQVAIPNHIQSLANLAQRPITG